MRKYLLMLSVWIAGVYSMHAQAKLDGAFDYAIFKTEDNIPYVEAYMKLFPGSFSLKADGSGLCTGDVEVLITVSTSPGKINWYDKYKLTTGRIALKDSMEVSIIDLKRFVPAEGKFKVELTIRDLNSLTPNESLYEDSITISFNKTKPQFSTPVLIDRYQETKTENIYSRAGYDIIPNPTGVYPGTAETMAFYVEAYETDKFLGEGERFAVKYYIKRVDNGAIIPGTEGIVASSTKKIYSALVPINIKNVRPGLHHLVVEMRNKNNELVTSVERQFNKGSKPPQTLTDLSSVGTDFMALVENMDTLREYIMCLDPIMPRLEQDFSRNVLKSGDKEMMKRYIVSFWLNRDPKNPQYAWLKYKAQVKVADKLFGTQFLRSYKTDRGRVFLQYGPPNVRTERPNEPGAWPYEIWQYYDMYNPITDRHQTNRKFVFWVRNEASNNYELLHSDALGEQKNERWELVLYNRGKGTTDIDQTAPEKQPGGQSRDLFNNPR